jgi:hypothetical protein
MNGIARNRIDYPPLCHKSCTRGKAAIRIEQITAALASTGEDRKMMENMMRSERTKPRIQTIASTRFTLLRVWCRTKTLQVIACAAVPDLCVHSGISRLSATLLPRV